MRIYLSFCVCLLVLLCVPQRTASANPFIISKPVYAWDGFYWGAHLGAAWTELLAPPSNDSGATEFSGGLSVGYDREFSRVVFGVLADVEINTWDDRGPVVDPSILAPQLIMHSKLNWFSTLRGRIGYRYQRFMTFATVGLAAGRVETELYAGPPGPAPFTTIEDDEWRFGYALGGGVEYLLTSRDAIGIEYLYFNLGDKTYGIAATGQRIEQEISGHTVRATFRYRF